MKALYIITFFLTFSFCSHAGKKDSLNRNFVAINVTAPLYKIFARNSFDSLPQSISAPFIYIGHQHKKIITKIGFSGSTRNADSSSQLTSDKVKENIFKLRAIASVYKFKNINARWQVQYGINASGVSFWSDQVFDSGFDKVNIYNRTYGGGIGPGIAFQFQASKRLKLFTEYICLYQFTRSEIGKRFSAIPNENYKKQQVNAFAFQFEYPISIYLQYLF